MKRNITVFALSLSLSVFPLLSLGQGNAAEEARTYLVRGLAAVEMAKSDEELAAAIDEFKKATEIDPTMATAWYNLGAVQAKTGRLGDAIDSYNHYLALSPKAEDAARIKDEVIKLGYRLEQSEKFKSLAGQWMTQGGAIARVDAESGKLTIRIRHLHFPDSADVSMYDDPVPRPNIYEDTAENTMRLDVRGSKLSGLFETPGGAGFAGWCVLPAERNQAEGTLEKGRIVLKLKKTKFTVVMNRNDSMFSSSKVRCDEVTAAGEVTAEVVLLGPLPRGGIPVASVSETQNGTLSIYLQSGSAEGLQSGDEIVAVNGTQLAQLKTYPEKIMQLRGQPGTDLQLTVRRVTDKGGVFSEPKQTTLNLTVRLVELK